MNTYKCKLCNFSSNLKSDMKRHLNTKKHINNIKEIDGNNKELCKIPSQNTQKPSKIKYEPPKTLRNCKKVYVCENCGKEFSRKDNLKRHNDIRCKHIDNVNLDYKKMFLEIKDELKKEKFEFNKHINLLLEKVGNTTNITQNIQLNSYGDEDVSHITDLLKTDMLKIPFAAIPKMIEAVHFNDKKPENKNISLSNIRDNKVKIYSEKGWIYKDKIETINDLVEGKYFILENFYEKNTNELKIDNKTNYVKFREFFNSEDKELVSTLKKKCELVLFNNRENKN